MGWDKEPSRCFLQDYFQEIPRIKSEDWPAIRCKITDSGQGFIDTFRRGKIRDKDQVMHFPDLAMTFINGTYLSTQDKAGGKRL